MNATASCIPCLPDGLPAQRRDEGSDSWCLTHGRIPWANDDMCGACEAAYENEENDCLGHPPGPCDPMGVTVYCDGTCRQQ